MIAYVSTSLGTGRVVARVAVPFYNIGTSFVLQVQYIRRAGAESPRAETPQEDAAMIFSHSCYVTAFWPFLCCLLLSRPNMHAYQS